jgi:GNAT superfamily N-acetyltransferase
MLTFSWTREEFLLSTDKALLQFDRIHDFLSKEAYWCIGIPENVVRNAAEASLCIGLYDITNGSTQIGYARIVTDYATFAWICDIYVLPAYRGNGLSKWMMECLMKLPALKNLRRICLATKDAHNLYDKFGFKVTETPGNWMEIKNNGLYKA